MERYQKNIGLKTLVLTIKRRFWVFLIIFIPILAAGYFTIGKVVTKSYQSTSTVTKSTVFTEADYQTLNLQITNGEFLDAVAVDLKNNNIKYSNGDAITSAAISSGLSMKDFEKNSISASLVFQSSDEKIVKDVLNYVSNAAVDALKEEKTFANFHVTSQASSPAKNSKESKYFIVVAISDFVLSFASAFIYELVSDEVYDKEDILSLGAPGFEVKLNNKGAKKDED